MKRRCLHIICGIALVLSLIGCNKGPRVIPRGKMARIYAEMFVTDQWINITPSVKRIADTSLVYEPILEKYGYTSEDYRRSVDVYMNDPERFSRILRTTVGILDKEISGLKELKEELDKPKFVIKTDFKAEDYFPFLSSEPYVHFYDSLTVEYDTTGFYRFSSFERADTIYDRLEMIVRADTLALGDSLAETVIPAEPQQMEKQENPEIHDELKVLDNVENRDKARPVRSSLRPSRDSSRLARKMIPVENN